MLPITWDEIIARAKLGLWADIQINQDDLHKRGPLVEIVKEEGGMLFFRTIWMARKDHSGLGWQNANGTGIKFSDQLRPMVNADSIVTFYMQNVCKVTIYPKTHAGGRLDPSQVNGLEGDEVRQHRAREYNLAPDASWRDIVEKMRDWASEGGVAIDDQRMIQDEAELFAKGNLCRFTTV